ncbi:MAG: hypothetical protein E5W26_21405, partial [Mesorhizobium sp.]
MGSLYDGLPHDRAVFIKGRLFKLPLPQMSRQQIMLFRLLRLILLLALVVSAPMSFDAAAQGLGQAP